jgi:hypothetical protein
VLRGEARRCRRLAKAQRDETVRDLLSAVADQFDSLVNDIPSSHRMADAKTPVP